jgi:hypothetical protein
MVVWSPEPGPLRPDKNCAKLSTSHSDTFSIAKNGFGTRVQDAHHLGKHCQITCQISQLLHSDTDCNSRPFD